jgi:thiamine biosynthesis protein ThiS
MTGDQRAGEGVTVRVNGDDRLVAPGTTVAGLVAEMGLEPRGLAVAVDGEVVTRRTWPDRALAAGEQVEVLSIAQGG